MKRNGNSSASSDGSELAACRKALRLAQRAAATSDHLLHTITDTALDSIFIKDSKRRYTFVNRAMTELMGCSASDLLGKTPEELFDAESARTVWAVDKRSFSGEDVSEERDLLIRGQTYRLHTIQVPMRDQRGHIVGVCGIVRNVTRRAKAEKELQAAQTRYLRIVENTNTVIYIVDADGRITYVSPSVASVTGYTPEKVLGRHFIDMMHPIDHKISLHSFGSLQKGALTGGREYRILHRDGSTRWIRLVSEPVLVDGHAAGIQGVLSDITEAKKAEEALRAANATLAAKTAELEKKNTVLKEVLAHIETEKMAVRVQVEANIKRLVSPILARLTRRIPDGLKGELHMLESGIQDIASRFGTVIGRPGTPLSPRENDIAHMIRDGSSTRQIAATLNLSTRTVEIHRNRIRKKLGISRRKVNLTTLLRQIVQQ